MVRGRGNNLGGPSPTPRRPRDPFAIDPREAVVGAQGSEGPWETGIALFLTLVGGYVDAIGYMVLFQLFIGHLSGDTIDMMVQLGRQNWGQAFHRGFPFRCSWRASSSAPP